jgi:hypothetical protein
MARFVEVVRAVLRVTMVRAVPVALEALEALEALQAPEETADNLTAVAGLRRFAIRHPHAPKRGWSCGWGWTPPAGQVGPLLVCRPVVCDLPPGQASVVLGARGTGAPATPVTPGGVAADLSGPSPPAPQSRRVGAEGCNFGRNDRMCCLGEEKGVKWREMV